MAQITGGSVTFGRTVQPAQYESKKSEVTITFAIAEDDAAEMAKQTLDAVASMAQTKALELVGFRPVENKALDKVTDDLKPTAAKRGPGRPPKADKPVEAAPKTEPAGAPDPLDLPRDVEAESKNEAAEAQAAKANDADADLLGTPAPKQITEHDLMDAVTKKMQEINDGPAIKAVREKYVPSPKGIRDIPPEKRQAFLDDLAKLTKKK